MYTLAVELLLVLITDSLDAQFALRIRREIK
jgi:hypothetical protein